MSVRSEGKPTRYETRKEKRATARVETIQAAFTRLHIMLLFVCLGASLAVGLAVQVTLFAASIWALAAYAVCLCVGLLIYLAMVANVTAIIVTLVRMTDGTAAVRNPQTGRFMDVNSAVDRKNTAFWVVGE